MLAEAGGAGQFMAVTLHPSVTISAKNDQQKALAGRNGPCHAFHRPVGELPVHADPEILIAQGAMSPL
ncbi:hypothetical protein BJF93_04650 [Xaviernesmea oryzae]|uniref:Uncharacterized protein n=1 Tax=Xaviernesmea oryzae TaxID=464029 RepID=A0A1Q9AUT7_9HYPH|nr:hypothetical protein BJF93_04650 [Xaviernesmea oryzae]